MIAVIRDCTRGSTGKRESGNLVVSTELQFSGKRKHMHMRPLETDSRPACNPKESEEKAQVSRAEKAEQGVAVSGLTRE